MLFKNRHFELSLLLSLKTILQLYYLIYFLLGLKQRQLHYHGVLYT